MEALIRPSVQQPQPALFFVPSGELLFQGAIHDEGLAEIAVAALDLQPHAIGSFEGDQDAMAGIGVFAVSHARRMYSIRQSA